MTLPDKTALAAEILRIVSAKDGEALRNFRCNANFRNPAILREWNSLISGCLTVTGADDPVWSLLLLQMLVPEEDVSLGAVAGLGHPGRAGRRHRPGCPLRAPSPADLTGAWSVSA